MYLELKHILPYIPFKLKAQDIRTKEIRTVTLLHFTYDLSTVGHNHLIYDGLLLSKHLPILRPISDLEEISPAIHNYLIKKCENYVMRLQQIDYNVLIENHFDVFGLIEQGLAISIHDIG